MKARGATSSASATGTVDDAGIAHLFRHHQASSGIGNGSGNGQEIIATGETSPLGKHKIVKVVGRIDHGTQIRR